MAYMDIIRRYNDLMSEPVVYHSRNDPLDRLRAHVRRARRGKLVVRNSLHAIRNIILISASVLATPLCFLASRAGYRFVSVDLKQIGSVLWVDSYIRRDQVKYNTPKRKILITRSKYTDANPYSLDLYNQYVTYISSPFLKYLLCPFFMNPFFCDKVIEFEHTTRLDVSGDTQWPLTHTVYQAYQEKFGRPLVSLRTNEIERGQRALKNILSPDRPFVALHVRDAGFYGDVHRTTRSADVKTYELAISYLIERGYYVVRMGNHTADPIDDLVERCGPSLIDYARSGLCSDFLDCYLTSQCEFYLGGASGLFVLPIVFGVPSCNVNFNIMTTALGFLEDDLVMFKNIKSIETNKLIPFESMTRAPFTQNPQHSILKQAGFYMIDNTSEEILRTVKEFMRHKELLKQKNWCISRIQKKAKGAILPSNFCYGALGNFSNAVLEPYFEAECADDASLDK